MMAVRTSPGRGYKKAYHRTATLTEDVKKYLVGFMAFPIVWWVVVPLLAHVSISVR